MSLSGLGAVLALCAATILSGPRNGGAALECDPEEPTICDDENFCTDDTCTSSGGVFTCNNTPIDCTDEQECTVDTCSSSAGGALCEHDDTLCNSSCGNGILEPGETCDDGNSASGCQVAHPQKPIDDCKNDCTKPICADPAKIKLATDKPDELKFHGRLVVAAGETIDLANNMVVIELTNGQTVIFRSSLSANTIEATTTGGFKYKNREARTAGGVSAVKARRAKDSYKVTLTTYGDLDAAISDMTTRLYIGTRQWNIHGLWTQTRNGWKLNGKSVFIQ